MSGIKKKYKIFRNYKVDLEKVGFSSVFKFGPQNLISFVAVFFFIALLNLLFMHDLTMKNGVKGLIMFDYEEVHIHCGKWKVCVWKM